MRRRPPGERYDGRSRTGGDQGPAVEPIRRIEAHDRVAGRRERGEIALVRDRSEQLRRRQVLRDESLRHQSADVRQDPQPLLGSERGKTGHHVNASRLFVKRQQREDPFPARPGPRGPDDRSQHVDALARQAVAHEGVGERRRGGPQCERAVGSARRERREPQHVRLVIRRSLEIACWDADRERRRARHARERLVHEPPLVGVESGRIDVGLAIAGRRCKPALLEQPEQRAALGRIGCQRAERALERHPAAIDLEAPVLDPPRVGMPDGTEEIGEGVAVVAEEVAPAWVEHLEVLFLAVIRSAAEALVVDDGQVTAVDDPVTGDARLDAEVYVLEAVDERLVEAAELEEQLARHCEARARDAVEVERGAGHRQVSGRVMEEVIREGQAVFLPHDPAVLDRPIRVEQPDARRAHSRLLHLLGQRLDHARRDLGVVVEEDQDLAGGRAGTGVAATGEVLVAGQVDDRRPVLPGGEELRGVVRGVVVDEHQLEAGAEAVAEGGLEGLQAAFCHRALAPGDDHYRCERTGGHGGSGGTAPPGLYIALSGRLLEGR